MIWDFQGILSIFYLNLDLILLIYSFLFQGWIYHGYEVEGLENIPDDGPALIVYYHGAMPLDYYYLLAKTFLVKKRHIRAVGDKFLFSIPGKFYFL